MGYYPPYSPFPPDPYSYPYPYPYPYPDPYNDDDDDDDDGDGDDDNDDYTIDTYDTSYYGPLSETADVSLTLPPPSDTPSSQPVPINNLGRVPVSLPTPSVIPIRTKDQEPADSTFQTRHRIQHAKAKTKSPSQATKYRRSGYTI
jgi:hypothetical protein